MATRKFSPAQIAAQKLFAERARAGTLKKDWLSGITPEHEDYDILRYYLDEKKNLLKTLGKGKRKPNPGLYENIDAKRKRIAAGSGEKMRKPGQAGRPTAKAFEQSAMTAKQNPITETLIYGLAPGETRDYMEELMYAGGQKLTQAQIDKVFKAAGDAGYHSFRVAGFDPTMKPDFAAAVRRKRNPDKSKPRAYVKRACQATGAPPSKRLVSRRKMALSAPAGYFPNPMSERENDQLSMMLSGITMAQAYNEIATSKKLTTLMLDWVKSPSKRDEIYKKSLEVAGSTGTSYLENPTKQKTNSTAMMTGYQVICMHPKKHVVGIFKTMAEAKMVATAMANAKGVPYGVKAVKVHKSHFAV